MQIFTLILIVFFSRVIFIVGRAREHVLPCLRWRGEVHGLVLKYGGQLGHAVPQLGLQKARFIRFLIHMFSCCATYASAADDEALEAAVPVVQGPHQVAVTFGGRAAVQTLQMQQRLLQGHFFSH